MLFMQKHYQPKERASEVNNELVEITIKINESVEKNEFLPALVAYQKGQKLVSEMGKNLGSLEILQFSLVLNRLDEMTKIIKNNICLELVGKNSIFTKEGRILLPEKAHDGSGYAGFHISKIFLDESEEMWKIYRPEKYLMSIEDAIANSEKNGCAVALAKNSENYPLASTALPLSAELYAESYRRKQKEIDELFDEVYGKTEKTKKKMTNKITLL